MAVKDCLAGGGCVEMHRALIFILGKGSEIWGDFKR
jgi:hypothetical protein